LGLWVDGVQAPWSLIDCPHGARVAFGNRYLPQVTGARLRRPYREMAGAGRSAEIAQVRAIFPGGTRYLAAHARLSSSWPGGHYHVWNEAQEKFQNPWVGLLELDRLKSILDGRVRRASGLSAGHPQRITG
jgi:hypothetical protein